MNIQNVYELIISKRPESWVVLNRRVQELIEDKIIAGYSTPRGFLRDMLLDMAWERQDIKSNRQDVAHFLSLFPKDLHREIPDEAILYWVDRKDWKDYRDGGWVQKNQSVKAEVQEQPRVRALILNDYEEILLGLEANRQEYGLPGGHLNPGELQLPLEGLKREVREETGLQVREAEYLFEQGREKVYRVSPLDMRLGATPISDPDKEFVLFQWFPLQKLPSMLNEHASDAIHRYLQGLEKSDLPQMAWASSWGDFVRGEWWLVGGQAIPADGDIGDQGHEAVALSHLFGEFDIEFNEKLGDKHLDADHLAASYVTGEIPETILTEVFGAELYSDLKKDIRIAYAKHRNAILVINSNFAAYKVDNKAIRAMQDFVVEETVEQTPASDESVIIEEYATGRHVTLSFLEFLDIKNPGQLWRYQVSAATEATYPGAKVSKLGNKYLVALNEASDMRDFKGLINMATKTAHINSFRPKTQDGAKKLLNWFEEWARSLGILRVVGESLPDAVGFWKDLGFKVVNRDSGMPPVIKKVLVPSVAAETDNLHQGDGKIEIFVDDHLAHTLDDDTIWEVLPRLAQERAKGRKISYRQVLPSGEVIDFDANPVLPDLLGH